MFVFASVMSYIAGLQDRKEEKGATAVEYALVIGLVSIVVVAAVALFGPKIATFVSGVTF